MAKARATKAKRKARGDDASKPAARTSEAPKAPSVPPPAAEAQARPRRSTRPPPPDVAADPTPPPAPPSVARWEERGDKDTYALDLLERLVRYYGGRASASSSEAMRSAAIVLSTLSLALTTSDDDKLAALARAARDVRKGSAT